MLNNHLADLEEHNLRERPILLAENEEEDIELIRRTLEKFRLINSFHVVRTGEEALAYLKGEGKFSDRDKYALPELFLLDLKVPGLDAFAVLRALRQQSHLKPIRVVVLASTNQTRELSLAFQSGANSFMFKPVRTERFIDTILSMNGCWMWVNTAQALRRSVQTG